MTLVLSAYTRMHIRLRSILPTRLIRLLVSGSCSTSHPITGEPFSHSTLFRALITAATQIVFIIWLQAVNLNSLAPQLQRFVTRLFHI
nr:unnamed protein product [Fasciola hepatica]